MFPQFLFAFLLIVPFSGINGENGGTCDTVLNRMLDSCKAVRATLISKESLDPNVACCKYARYNLCLQSVKAYVSASTSVKLCDEADYKNKIEEMDNNIAMKAVAKLCENYDSKTCITDTMTSAWNSLSETLNPTTLSNNFNEAMSSIRNFFSNLGSSQGERSNDQYTVVPDKKAAESENSFSFSKLFNSFSSPVEFVPKNNNEKQDNDGSGNQFLTSIRNILGQ